MADHDSEFGILACGSYWPRWHIARQTIADSVGWVRGRTGKLSGQRSFAHWDEDSLTMAVEACQATMDQASTNSVTPESLMLASTSLPFAERSNAGLIAEALGLNSQCQLTENGGSRRAGTGALLSALNSGKSTLVCASECVDTRAGSEGETEVGHGASAVLLGHGEPLATLVASAGFNEDFVDRYRMSDQRFDYRLEARWVRDAGIRSQVKRTIQGMLKSSGLEEKNIDWFLAPAATPVVASLMRDCGLQDANPAAELNEAHGLCGTAQPLQMLHYALANAKPGERILLLGLGQGVDALLFEVNRPANDYGLTEAIEEEPSYVRYLGLRQLLDIDRGIRAERDNRSSQSAAYRHHSEINGFIGGRCPNCNKLQFPSTESCVHCHWHGEQTPVSMAAMPGEVNSFTEDWLAYSPRPPLIFGNVHFPDGANVMLEFTDFQAGELSAGQAVRMAFRIKDIDERRGFRRYFWKPAPVRSAHG